MPLPPLRYRDDPGQGEISLGYCVPFFLLVTFIIGPTLSHYRLPVWKPYILLPTFQAGLRERERGGGTDRERKRG